MSVLDDVNALSPADKQALFGAIAPQLAAQNYAMTVNAEVDAAASANDAVNALRTKAANLIAAGDFTQSITDDDIAAMQASIVSATVATTRTRIASPAQPAQKVTG